MKMKDKEFIKIKTVAPVREGSSRPHAGWSEGETSPSFCFNMNWEAANQSWYSANTIAGTVSSALTAGLNTGTAAKLKSMGDKGAAIQKFYGGAINIGVSAAGKAAEYGVHAAYSLAQGGTLKDAYDNMGGISVNVMNLGAIADMIGSGIARNDAGGQANRWSELAQKLGGAGVLEINFASEGISGKIGSGGIDLGGNLYTFAKRMNDRARLESYGQNHSQAQSDAAYWAYVYGDWTQENTAARIASEKDVLEIVSGDGKPAGWTAQTVQNGEGNGRIIQMLDSGDKHINAILLGHESYRDGVITDHSSQKAETINAVLAHSAMAERMTQYNQKLSGTLALEAALYKAGRTDILAALADGMYDSSGDFWLIHNNGSVSWDGNLNLYVEKDIYDKDGNLIINKKLMADENGNGIIRESPDEAVNYRQLQDFINNADGDTVNISGVDVKVDRLKEIAKINDYIINSSIDKNGNYTSYAAAALLSDGYMSYDEAVTSEKIIFARSAVKLYEKTAEAVASNFLLSAHDPISELENIRSLLNAISPNMIEHYSTRYVLNQNDEFKSKLNENTQKSDWANFERDSMNLIDNWDGIPMTLLSPEMSIYHGDKNALKFTLKNGRELVLQPDYNPYIKEKNAENILNWHFDTNEATYGTYNYSTFAPAHFVFDMWSYYKWGNTPDDMYTTDINKRIHPDYYNWLQDHDSLKDLSTTFLKGYTRWKN